MTKTNVPSDLVTVHDGAAGHELHEMTLRRAMYRGELRFYKRGPQGKHFVSRAEVADWYSKRFAEAVPVKAA